MKRILLGLLITGTVGTTAILATNAYFSDTQTSGGNSFTAGTLKLQLTNNTSASSGVTDTSDKWSVFGDIGNKVMMKYSDIKPGDYGENSVSLKVSTNDAWACIRAYNITDSGVLSQKLNFIWWADTNGNNSLDNGEQVMFNGPVTLATIKAYENFTLADSTWNAFTFSNSGPLTGNNEYQLGIGWCLGSITENRSAVPGFKCDGANVGNEVQANIVTGTFEFSAAQSRNQPGYLCPEHQGQ